MDLDQFKQAQKAIWGLGDYPSFAALIDPASELSVSGAGVGAGDRVLDVATGTGNAAVRAAALGAHVTGLDLSAELLEVATARASSEGLAIEFVEGDAEALPFPDHAFDRVISVFGAIFAPRHALVAAELLRVTRPGGTIALAAWTPDSVMGRMIANQGRFLPPPEGAESPADWGDREHASAVLGAAAELRFETHEITFRAASVDDWVARIEDDLGPLIAARAALTAAGRWPEAQSTLRATWTECNQAEDGTMIVPAPYLLILARV